MPFMMYLLRRRERMNRVEIPAPMQPPFVNVVCDPQRDNSGQELKDPPDGGPFAPCGSLAAVLPAAARRLRVTARIAEPPAMLMRARTVVVIVSAPAAGTLSAMPGGLGMAF